MNSGIDLDGVVIPRFPPRPDLKVICNIEDFFLSFEFLIFMVDPSPDLSVMVNLDGLVIVQELLTVGDIW